ncbi:Do family serine endopeptidase [Palleronia sp. LCG004]|uniref:Do family serine endopeptidase n=1 Tax=Palleronia sp. LCG004 TaxID=3079304 RepID=UPI00294320AF|nr:Do family serine endopeptidase [Palleronia sp. LCG004]WOI55653.1 Do family serine endopeptidase [Palleronia sp. LCG004]
MTSIAIPQGQAQVSPRQWFTALFLGIALAVTQAASAKATPETFAPLAEQISDSVVNITTSTTVSSRTGPAPQIPEGSPFEDFFRDFMERGPGGEADPAPRSRAALGSGFVISEDGFIVTNNHVIQDADEINIEFYNGEQLPAEVIGTDPNTDIALLKVTSDAPLQPVPFGNSDEARVGDWVVAMGNPLGQGFSVSAGIVSARNRALSGTYDDYIQTDAAINRGNSGGPLFNMDGEVVGVNTAILSPNGGSIGIGFAMSSNVVTKVVDQLREFGETRRGWLGVSIQDVTDDIAESIGLENVSGALVTDVPEGPAQEAGVEAGDVITGFNGNDVVDTRELVRRVGDAEVGTEVPVTVYRDGEEVELSVTLGRREEAQAIRTAATPEEVPQSDETELLGLTVSPLDEELREELGLSSGMDGLVITEVADDSEAFEKGIRAGDVITEAGQEKIASASDLTARVEAAQEAGRKSILLLIRRDGNPRFVALPVE